MKKLACRRPDIFVYDPIHNIKVHTEIPHLDVELAHRLGLPGPFDAGIERECMIATLLDNWG